MATKNSIKILTLNIYGSPLSLNKSQRLKLLGKELYKMNADLFFLQEVLFLKDRQKIINSFGKKYFKFYPEKHRNFGHGGLLLITKNIEANSFKFIKFDDQGPLTFLALTDRVAGKGFQHGVINIGGEKINIINTHLLCKYNDGFQNTKSFNNQFNQLSEYLNNLAGQHTLLAGDLNFLSTSDELRVLNQVHKLRDTLNPEVFTVVPENTNRRGITNYFANIKGPFRTDFILLSNNLVAQNTKVLLDEKCYVNGKYINLSDHFGIMCQVTLK
jgi:endonuclease/exonuclease/phosphatase family metal-dependent hydrolase